MSKKSSLGQKMAEDILCSVLNISPAQFFLKKNELILSAGQIKKFDRIEAEIQKGLPLQYALGQAEFYGRDFTVNRDVLIPRPESELLVEYALKYLQKKSRKKLRIIDLGCGSGCLIISIAKESENKRCEIFAADVSAAALRVAKANARKHRLKQIKFYRSDLFSSPKLPAKFDLIIANLPYLPANYLQTLPKPIVRSLKYEPKIALSGGRDGLDIIKKLIRLLPQKLDRDGLALIEFDPSQTNAAKKLLKKIDLKFQVIKDLNGRNRLCAVTKG